MPPATPASSRPTNAPPARGLVGQVAVDAALAAAQTGCGKRGSIALVPPGEEAGPTVVHTFVATSRAPAPASEFFSSRRSFRTEFANFDV